MTDRSEVKKKEVSNGSKKAWSWFSMLTPDMGMACSSYLWMSDQGGKSTKYMCGRWTLRAKTHEMKINGDKSEVMGFG